MNKVDIINQLIKKMTEEVKAILKKRFFSFLWKLGAMIVTYFLAFVMANIDMFGLPVLVTTITGLIASEVTKFFGQNLPKLMKELNKE